MASPQPPKRKAQKGTVRVEVFRDRLRLRWSYRGRRYCLTLELPDSATNRKVAEAKARGIERDMATETFDPTLERYRPTTLQGSVSVTELFDQFKRFKSTQIYPQSLAKYEGLEGYLQQFFKRRGANEVGESDALKFRDYLAKKIAPVTLRERIALLRSCWNWGLKRKLVAENPWLGVVVKVSRQARPWPFTTEEIRRILEGFRTDPDYSYLTDYVEFLMGTGCRINEAIGLKWKHLNPDCSTVHFVETYSRGQWKGLKEDDERWVTLTPKLQQMLRDRRPDGVSPDAPVFAAAKGGLIDDHNFRNRAWKSVLQKVGIPYRKPRSTRSTLASHALDRGMSPAEVSALTGHTQETLFRHYAGHIKSRPQLPDLLGD